MPRSLLDKRFIKGQQGLVILTQSQVKRICKIQAVQIRRQRIADDMLMRWFEIRQAHQQMQAVENLIRGAVV